MHLLIPVSLESEVKLGRGQFQEASGLVSFPFSGDMPLQGLHPCGGSQETLFPGSTPEHGTGPGCF